MLCMCACSSCAPAHSNFPSFASTRALVSTPCNPLYPQCPCPNTQSLPPVQWSLCTHPLQQQHVMQPRGKHIVRARSSPRCQLCIGLCLLPQCRMTPSLVVVHQGCCTKHSGDGCVGVCLQHVERVLVQACRGCLCMAVCVAHQRYGNMVVRVTRSAATHVCHAYMENTPQGGAMLCV